MRDFLPAIYDASGVGYRTGSAEESFNIMPIMLHGKTIGAHPRNEMVNANDFTPSSSADRGRGIFAFSDDIDLYLDQDTYYYNGGNQDLTATTGNGYAGNTGFNEEYIATTVSHRVSGIENIVIVNAGHTSTNASANHGNVWYTADNSTAPSSVTDADMPGNNGVSIVRGGASLDGYFFLCDINGQIHNSNINDITAWTSTDFLTAEREADIAVYLGKIYDTLVYIGTKSIEFFYNAGNATGSPLARRQDVSYRIGCYTPNSITEAGDSIYFVGVDQKGWAGVYAIENYQVAKISDAKIDKLLRGGIGATFPDISDLDSLSTNVYMVAVALGESFGLMLTIGGSFTYHWHKESGQWYRWTYNATPTYPGNISGWSSIFPIVSHNRTSKRSAQGLYQLTNGVTCYEGSTDNDTINDLASSNAPDSYILFKRWDAGTGKKKRINSLRVITESLASDGGDFEPANAEIRWFDYDRTESSGPNAPDDFVAGRTINLNIRGPMVARLGSCRERAWLLHFSTGHGPLTVVKGLEIDYDIVE